MLSRVPCMEQKRPFIERPRGIIPKRLEARGHNVPSRDCRTSQLAPNMKVLSWKVTHKPTLFRCNRKLSVRSQAEHKVAFHALPWPSMMPARRDERQMSDVFVGFPINKLNRLPLFLFLSPHERFRPPSSCSPVSLPPSSLFSFSSLPWWPFPRTPAG